MTKHEVVVILDELDKYRPRDKEEASEFNKLRFRLCGRIEIESTKEKKAVREEEKAKWQKKLDAEKAKKGGNDKIKVNLDEITLMTQEEREECAAKILDQALLSGEMTITELDRFKDELGLGIKQRDIQITLVDYTKVKTHYDAQIKPE